MTPSSAEPDDFLAVHDHYLAAWERALGTGDATPVEEFLATDYHGWFAPASRPEVAFDRFEGIAGMRQSVAGLAGAQVSTGRRAVSRRGGGDAVVTYDRVITHEGRCPASALVVEAWSRTDHGWQLHRELTEHDATAVDEA